jgi:putative ABC transport system substrate-binding protein
VSIVWGRSAVSLAFAVASTSLAAAVTVPRAPRVALIRSSAAEPIDLAARAIATELRREWPAAEVTSYELRDASDGERVLAQIHKASPDILIPLGSRAAVAAVRKRHDVPVVFSMVLYPEQEGLVGPGVTGASIDVPFDEQFQFVHRLLPKARVLGIVYNADETGVVVAAARRSAGRLGLRLETERVDGPENALRAVDRLTRRVDVIVAVADSNVFTPLTTGAIHLAALRRRVPLIGLSASQVRTGALAALTVDYADVGRQTATLATRVLRGERPDDIRPLSARKLGVVVNARTARRLGLRIDPMMQRRAAEVVR